MRNKVPLVRLHLGEFGYVALMLVVSGYMFYGSYEYSGLAGSFPRGMAAIVFLLAFFLLIRRIPVVPDIVRRAVEGGTGSITDQASDSVDVDQDEEADSVDVDQDEEEVKEERTGTTKKTTILGLLTAAYMLFGFLFGLLWGTPLFVISYLRYMNYSWSTVLSIALVVTLIVYAMMDIFNFTLETGYAFDMLGIEVPLSIAADAVRPAALSEGVI